MNSKIVLLTLLVLAALIGVGCAPGEAPPPEEMATPPPPAAEAPRTVTLMSHDSFAISEEVMREFEQTHNARVVLLPAGDTGTALNQAILARDNPLADVFFGVDNTFMGRALAADLFEPYDSPLLAEIRDDLKLDETLRLLPVDYGDVCLNYDRNWFGARALPPPQELLDLVDPAYNGLTVVQNPATSSPGLAFLMTTIAAFGAEGEYTYLDYWRELRANDVRVTDGWTDAYVGHFTASGTGDRPIVVSYASSPPAEIIFADPPVDEPPTAAVTESGACFRQVEFVGILRGNQNRQLAEQLIDFMLGRRFQEDIPMHMFVFPANRNADLPEVFVQWADIPAEPAFLSPAEIDAHREAWIQAWTDVVLR
jgi:thiamine transport system substrate-binding protein